MTYHELLEKYKAGALEEKDRGEVERAIEKHEAISNYLYEEEIPELSELLEGREEKGRAEEQEKHEGRYKTDQSEFTVLVNRSIRRAFMRLGAAVLAISLLLLLFFQFCLPRLVSGFFYNPGGEKFEGQNQMSLDMAVYSELLLPCRYRENVTVDAKGYGAYDFCIWQNVSYNGRFTSVAGEIHRGKIKFYNNDLMQRPTGNCFTWYQVIGDLSKPLTEAFSDQSYNVCAAGTPEQALETLRELRDDGLYIGYVSLNQMMDYETFVEYVGERDDILMPWCAVKTSDIERYNMTDEAGTDQWVEEAFRASNLGFHFELSSSTSLTWDKEKYPGLLLWETPEAADETAGGAETAEETSYDALRENIKSEPFMRQHFVSLLRYMADQERFLEMMDAEQIAFSEAADYVEQNGIVVYGFAALMDKETMLELCKEEEIYEIYVQDAV